MKKATKKKKVKRVAKKKATKKVIKAPVEPNDGRLNLRIDPGLKAWAQDYADRCSTTVTQIIVQHLTILRQRDEQVLAADAEQL